MGPHHAVVTATERKAAADELMALKQGNQFCRFYGHRVEQCGCGPGRFRHWKMLGLHDGLHGLRVVSPKKQCKLINGKLADMHYEVVPNCMYTPGLKRRMLPESFSSSEIGQLTLSGR